MTTEQPFDIVVDNPSENPPTIDPPSSWTAETQIVNNLTVHVHTHRTPKTTTGFPILTFHDIGQNASAFASLLAVARHTKATPDAAAAHYHISAPGHEPHASDVLGDVDFSIDALANSVTAVLDRFEIPRVIGLGIGIGATILLRAAEKRPRAVAGLVLISPLLHAAPLYDRLISGVDNFLTRTIGLGLSRHLKDRLLYRWMSEEAQTQLGAAASLEERVDRLNARNVVRFMLADSYRENSSASVKEIKAKVLLITGKDSSLRYHTADMFAQFDPEKTSWLDVHDCGSLVHEEEPERVAEAVGLFLQGLPGYT